MRNTIFHEAKNYTIQQKVAYELERVAAEKHKDHGRGTEEHGPDDPDCPCRGTENQFECAVYGCGFCRAAERLTPHP